MPQTNPSSASFKMDSKIKKITPSQLTGLRTQQDEYEEIDYSGKDLGQAVETMIKKTIQVKKKTHSLSFAFSAASSSIWWLSAAAVQCRGPR